MADQTTTLRVHLRDLSKAVTAHLEALDAEMALPHGPERGGRIAALANALEIENDRARFFALGVDYRKKAARG